jgi:plastocyanin
VVVAAAAVPALAATVLVSVVDNAFQPRDVVARQGDTVQWDWNSFSSHSVTDRTGMSLYDSGVRGAGSTFSFTFDSAGLYDYWCTIHFGMTGTVSVPINAKPKRGRQDTTFTITFSAANAPAGFVFDAQIKRPGAPFVDWQTGVTNRTATFVPDAGRGKYQFRSRLRKTSNGEASAYSTAKRITVR